jgi:hypothetical protein
LCTVKLQRDFSQLSPISTLFWTLSKANTVALSSNAGPKEKIWNKVKKKEENVDGEWYMDGHKY